MTENNPRRYDSPHWYYGQDGPIAWCHIPPRPPDDWSWTRAAYVWHRPVSFDFEIRPPVLPRWRRWTRRHLWFATSSGRQTRELRRLLDRIDRQARERGL